MVVNQGGKAVVKNNVAILLWIWANFLPKSLRSQSTAPIGNRYSLRERLKVPLGLRCCRQDCEIRRQHWRVSQRGLVYGFVSDSPATHTQNGAFAGYTTINSKLLYRVDHKRPVLSGKNYLPEDSVRSVDGLATLPISLNTAVIILLRKSKVELSGCSATTS